MQTRSSVLALTFRMVVVLAFLILMPAWALVCGYRQAGRDSKQGIQRAMPAASVPAEPPSTMTSKPAVDPPPPLAFSENPANSRRLPPVLSPTVWLDSRVSRTSEKQALRRQKQSEADRKKQLEPSPAPPKSLYVDTNTVAEQNEIRQMQWQLKQLGVTYMVLQRVDPQPPEQQTGGFRFYCRVPLPESSLYLRPFEATASMPAIAMAQVVRDVERWLSAGRVVRAGHLNDDSANDQPPAASLQ